MARSLTFRSYTFFEYSKRTGGRILPGFSASKYGVYVKYVQSQD